MSTREINEVNGENVQYTVQPVIIPSNWDQTNAIIRQGMTYDRKQVHWVNLRQQHNLDTSFSKTLTSTSRVEVEKVLSSHAVDAPKAEPVSFSAQLEVLQGLVKKLPEEDEARGAKLIEVCENEIAKAQSYTNYAAATTAFLGQMIYLLETSPKATLDRANATYYRFGYSLQSYIKGDFEKIIIGLKSKLDDQAETERRLGITDADAYQTAQLPRIMAKVLITSTGFFNDAIGDILIAKLLSNEEGSYKEKVRKNLSKYKEDARLVELLKAAKAPESAEMKSNTLIRATLNLSHSKPITDLHAKRAHLASQLASLEQDTMPERLRSFHLDKAAVDLNALLENSCIERTINGNQITFNYTLENDDAALDQKIRMDNQGKLLDGKGDIQYSIALTRAAKAMGIEKDEISGAIKASVEKIFEDDTINATTPRAIIAELAKRFPENEVVEKTDIGNFSFSSIACTPLLQAWESSVNSAGSHQSQIRARAKILGCVQSALYNEFKAEHSTLADRVKGTFQDFITILNANIKLKLSDDKSHYEILDIQTAEQFKTLLIRTLDTAILKGATEAVSELAVNGMMTLVSKLDLFIKSNTFLELALSHFHAGNKDNVGDNLDALEHLPWKAPYGNNHFEFLDAHFKNEAEKLEEITPGSAAKLWEQLIEFTRKAEQSQNEMVEVISTQHTSSLLANHPSFASRNVTEKNAEECLAAYQAEFDVNQEVVTFSDEQRKQITGYVASRIVDPNLVIIFSEGVTRIRKDLSTSAFRKAIYELGVNYAPELNEESKAAEGRELDRFIFKSVLSEEQKAALKPVHFADTHLIVDGQNVHLCFYQDPFAKAVKLGLVLADSRGLLPLNQDKWVENKPWLLAKTAVAPVNEAT